jgi:hypothetical protein
VICIIVAAHYFVAIKDQSRIAILSSVWFTIYWVLTSASSLSERCDLIITNVYHEKIILNSHLINSTTHKKYKGGHTNTTTTIISSLLPHLPISNCSLTSHHNYTPTHLHNIRFFYIWSQELNLLLVGRSHIFCHKTFIKDVCLFLRRFERVHKL